VPRNEVSVVIRAKDLAGRVLTKFRRTLKGVTRVAKDVGRSMLAFSAAIGGALFGLAKLTERVEAIINVKRAFARMTDDETKALESLRRAANGTIGDFQLMSLHNQALALGAAKTTEEFAKMIQMSRVLGRTQGIEATEALEKFTAGLARQSKLRLDDLGIVLTQAEANKRYAAELDKEVDNLTDAEKKTAFRNEALRQGAILMEKLAGKQLEGAAAAGRFATMVANLRDRMAEVSAQSPIVAQFFDQLTGLLGDIVDLFGSDTETLKAGMESLGRIAGNAFSIGVLQAVKGVQGLLGDIILSPFPQKIRDRLTLKGTPFEHEGESQAINDAIEEATANIKAEREVLASIARGAEERRKARKELGKGESGGGGVGAGGGGSSAAPIIGSSFAGTEKNLKGLLAAIQSTRSALRSAKLDRAIAGPGDEAEKAAKKLKELTQRLSGLQAIAARFGGEGAIKLDLGTLGPLSAARLPNFFDPEAVRRFQEREAFVRRREQFVGPVQLFDLTPQAPAASAEELRAASLEFGDASKVAVASFGAMAEAAIRGSDQMATSVISAITRIIQSTKFGGGLFGTILGAVGGIAGALFGKRDRPLPVRIDDVTSDAQRKLRDARKRPVRVTTIIEQGGVEISRIERELYDRQERDEVVRFPTGR